MEQQYTTQKAEQDLRRDMRTVLDANDRIVNALIWLNNQRATKTGDTELALNLAMTVGGMALILKDPLMRTCARLARQAQPTQQQPTRRLIALS